MVELGNDSFCLVPFCNCVCVALSAQSVAVNSGAKLCLSSAARLYHQLFGLLFGFCGSRGVCVVF